MRAAWSLSLWCLVSGCDVQVRARPAPTADLVLTKARLRSWSDGQLTALTTAERIEVSRESGVPGSVAALDAGVLFVKQGAQVRAPEIRGNFLSGQLEATGGVTMVGRGNSRATSERISFDRSQGANGVASTDAGVHFTRPGLEVDADAFSIDIAEESATFEGIRSTFTRRL